MKATKSARERREEVKQKRSDQSTRATQKQRKRRKAPRTLAFWLWTSFAVVIVLVLVGVVINSLLPSGSIPGVVTYSNLSRNHVTGTVNYPQVPPVGGSHNPVWLNCGIYTAPVANENAVHAMEHGAVWVTYQPSLSASDTAHLQSIVGGQTYVILSPYPGLPAPVVLSAWGVQLKVNSVTDPRIEQFLTKYRQGPQTPELGAACDGGTGSPDMP